MRNIVIVGAGGFGREILAWMTPCFQPAEYPLKGFLACDDSELDGFNRPASIIGSPDSYQPELEDRFLMAIGDPQAKRFCAESLLSRGAQFLTMIHPNALVAENATVGVGVVVYPFGSVSAAAEVGDFVHMNFYASIGHDASIGNYTTLSPYASVSGAARVGEAVLMGTQTSVAPTRQVGDRCKISSGSAVMHDIADDSLVFGVPGRQTKLVRTPRPRVPRAEGAALQPSDRSPVGPRDPTAL